MSGGGAEGWEVSRTEERIGSAVYRAAYRGYLVFRAVYRGQQGRG